MRLTYDCATSSPVERVLDLALRPFGREAFVERHQVGSWQWGIDLPNEEHPSFHLWAGPLHVIVSRA